MNEVGANIKKEEVGANIVLHPVPDHRSEMAHRATCAGGAARKRPAVLDLGVPRPMFTLTFS